MDQGQRHSIAFLDAFKERNNLVCFLRGDLYVVQNVLLLVILLVVSVVFLADFIVTLINPVATRESENAPL